MDFQSMMETFAEAWVAANTQTPLTEAAAAAAAAAAANDHLKIVRVIFFEHVHGMNDYGSESNG
ncbi:hypothetical protein DERP_000319 [Dermatophagoides pteronyssinus]|uniref:Uncharacterized protein n=1 Tax=Dermatophagoides pteronyssinus TaxID=6956 RepID=A0ABQ8IZX7_DERPT|nr:hypothetical protein DERP_000319 [Dermatophagoides pteronyssinus]